MVSVIIVSYNTKDLTKACLKSVMEKTQDVDFDICVVDNASTDGSPEELKEAFPGIRILENRINGGFARANNQAIRESRADYVFILNSDTILVNNAIKILFTFMEQEENRNVACCGGCLYDENMVPQTSYGNFPSLTELVFRVLKLKKLFPRYYRERLKSSTEYHGTSILQVDYVTGADMFIRRSVLDQIGLFDEDFFLYFEDSELSCRMARSGYRSMVVPQAKIIHLAGKSATDFPKMESARVRERSRFLFFRKCYGAKAAFLAKTLCTIHYARRLLPGFGKKNWEMLKITWKA